MPPESAFLTPSLARGVEIISADEYDDRIWFEIILYSIFNGTRVRHFVLNGAPFANKITNIAPERSISLARQRGLESRIT
jgi:hypothetical protein